jgi:hypothetical protein
MFIYSEFVSSEGKLNDARVQVPQNSRPYFTVSFEIPPTWSKSVTLRPTINRSVRLDVRRPSGTRVQFFFLLEICFQTVTVCYVVTPSLTRGRVCNLL